MNKKILEPSYSSFQNLIGQEFRIDSEEQPIRLELKEVEQLKPATTRADLGIRTDPFSLVFKELTSVSPDQKTYTVESDAGTIVLFLVPVGFGEYQAIFN